MEAKTKNKRLDLIPVLFARGTHEEIGFSIGRTFKYMIDDVLEKSEFFNQFILPTFNTTSGREVFDRSLSTCKKRYPNLVKELEGIANGANVSFDHLFLLQMEYFISPEGAAKKEGVTGCSCILSNFDELIMAHTEDTGPELLNNIFIVSAEVLNEKGEKLEKFTSLTYAGCLPGYTMGFNEHGMVHTVNTLCPVETCYGKTPRTFIARAILGASNLEEVLEILRDKGSGIADGFSLNMHFAKQEGPKLMYSVEIGPNPSADESRIDVYTVPAGDSYVHCNKYIRMEIPQTEKAILRSDRRHDAIARHPQPQKVQTVKEIMSDQSDPEYAVFRTGEKEPDLNNTAAVGIFEIAKRKWSIYKNRPIQSKPLAVLPLDF